MKTRKEYLDGTVTHSEYYGQFVTDAAKQTVLQRIGKRRIVESNDPNFNDISLAIWDQLPLPAGTTAKMKEAGDYPTMAGNVCIYKEAARQIKESA